MFKSYYLKNKQLNIYQNHILYIEAYQNGREQGVCITLGINECYYVCEPRRSDGICIYVGKISNQSIHPEAYENPNHFEYIEDAANFIIEKIELETFYFCKRK